MKTLKMLSEVKKMSWTELNEYLDIVWEYTERALTRKDALYSVFDGKDNEGLNVIESGWRRYYFICNHFDLVMDVYRNFKLN